jgi:hypothetical protein
MMWVGARKKKLGKKENGTTEKLMEGSKSKT